MLKSKTVFILGAGASEEVGFPLGSMLKKIIASKLAIRVESGYKRLITDENIEYAICQKYSSNFNEFSNACQQISKGVILSDSIDDFIDIHKHDELITICGKLAIAYSIAEAEKCSNLFVDTSNMYDTIDFSSVDHTWYAKFYSILAKQIPKASLNSLFDNVTVISFNYDRSLEHFVIHAVSSNYIISKEEAKAIVSKLVIYHPYGVLDYVMPYGSNELPDVNTIITNLKTYTEQVENIEGLNQVHQAIQDAEILVFLGNAYHLNNMYLLQTHSKYKKQKIYATRLGFSNDDLHVIIDRITNLLFSDNLTGMSVSLIQHFKSNILFAEKCSDVFDKYRLSLSEH